MKYYNKIDKQIIINEDGKLVMDYFGLTKDDLIRMSPEELKSHCKKFSDVLNDGKITGAGITGSGKVTQHNRTSQFTSKKNTYDGGWQTMKQDFNYADSGSFSRYFDLDKWFETTFPFAIIPKPSKKEKNMGLDKWITEPAVRFASTTNSGDMFPTKDTGSHIVRGNFHPTVKPLKLMCYLIMLGSREGDIILDPFCGSGTTLIAAKMLQRVSVGIEINEDYIKIAEARLATNK